jgi:methionyl-tRNA formyltransferase
MEIWSNWMTKKSITVVFFGSGPLAAKSLELLAQDFEIEAVITKASPLGHRGEVPVLNLSKKLGIKAFPVENKAQLDNLIESSHFSSDLGILIDFGIIVSQEVIDYFKKGIINSHFSLLPEWRGADPISFALLSGQKSTGVSLMLLVKAMDEGPLLAYSELSIDSDATNPSLSGELVDLSHELLKEFVPRYLEDSIEAQAQDITGREVSYSRKLTKNDGIIDWDKSADKIEHEIRAFIEWPKSHTKLGGIEIIITSGHVVPAKDTKPGNFKIDNNELLIDCGEDSLSIDKLKPSGKPEMSIQAFLAGYTGRLA